MVERQSEKKVTAPQHLLIHALTHVGTHVKRFSTLCVLQYVVFNGEITTRLCCYVSLCSVDTDASV